jgi:hypothetical protein
MTFIAYFGIRFFYGISGRRAVIVTAEAAPYRSRTVNILIRSYLIVAGITS